MALYVNKKTTTYFDSFGIEHILKEVKKFIGDRNIITNIYRIQNYNSITCGYFLLDLSIICLWVKAQQIILIFIHKVTSKRMMTTIF